MRTVDTDVVVVGAGAFGLTVAARLGQLAPAARVLLLERDSRLRSSAEIGSGSVIAAGTRMQAQAGVADDAEIMARDIVRKSGGAADPALVRRLCDESAGVAHWLADDVGVPLELAREAGRVGHSRLRLHATPERSGRRLIGALRTFALGHANVTFLDRAPGERLLHAGGTVHGIVARHDGEELEVRAGATVVASGGFAADGALVAAHLPAMRGAPYIGVDGHRGDALRWATEVGAQLRDLGCYLGQGYVIHGADGPPGGRARLNPGVVTAGAIMVDASGRRFAREDQGYSEWAGVVRGRPGGWAVAIWDQEIHRAYAGTALMLDAQRAGGVHGPCDLAALAADAGLPPGPLAATVERYNGDVARGGDALGRAAPGRALEGPLYWARVTGALVQTLGGIAVDADGRALDPRGAPLERLYAGGAAAAGLAGDSPAGYLSGSGLLTAFGLGHVVAGHLAAHGLALAH